MWNPIVAVLPLLTALGGVILITVLHGGRGLTLRHRAQLQRRARWAAERDFAPISSLSAAADCRSALPGLASGAEQMMVLDAFERDSFLIAGLAVLTDSVTNHRSARAEGLQTLTLARVSLGRGTPVVEVRPLSSWPANRQLVTERSVALSQEAGFASGQVPTLLTGDCEFDDTFVVRTMDKRGAKELLSRALRTALRDCPRATFTFSHGSLLVTEPGLVDDVELDRLAHVIARVKAALALPAYVA